MHEDVTARHTINEPILPCSVKNTPIWMIIFSKKPGPVFPEPWEVHLSGTKCIASSEWMMTGWHSITRLLSYCNSRRDPKLFGGNTLVPHISIGPFDTQTQHKQKLNQMTALHTHTRIIKQQTWVWRQDLFFSPWIRDDFWLTKPLLPLGNHSCPNRSAYLCKITKLRLSSKENSSLKAKIPSY